jgi:uncharacterized protein YraI
MVTSAANGSAGAKWSDVGLSDREETTVSNRIERGIGQMLVSVDEAMGSRLDRRQMLKRVALVGAAAVAGAAVKAMPAGAEEPIVFLKATKNLNLREKPSTSGKVIVVIPKGAKVALIPEKTKNGYRHVDYHGAIGWAYADYLILAASEEGAAWVGKAKTTANVNLRNGPSTNYEVLEVVPKGTTVTVSDWVSGGFRYVKVNGVTGWISEKYLNYL